MRKDGSYTKGSVHGLVRERLKKMLSDGIRLEKKFGATPRKKRKPKKEAAQPDNG